jgi:RNA polymerase sigma-70 factor (ECF subfamily)
MASHGLTTSVEPAPMSSPEIPAALAGSDRESRDWLERLRAPGSERDAAVTELHVLLLRAARFEITRRYATSAHLRGGDMDDLAHQSADDALVAILGKLGDFRGASRFTTWAYKFALYEAAAKVRKRAWQRREIPLAAETWCLFADDHRRTPEQGAETMELLGGVQQGIEQDLSTHQREVLVAIVLNDVPIDVLAERLNTSRGALYKTVHDARQKLRAGLTARGLSLEDQRTSA